MAILKKLLNKHTLSLASNAVMPVIGMLTVSLLARNLTEADFGNWILFLISFTIATLIRSGFLQTSLVKFYSGVSEEKALNIAGSTWVLAFALTLAVAIISFSASFIYHGHHSTELTIQWFGIVFFGTLPSSIALWILQAEQRFDRIFILQMVGQCTFLVAIVILRFTHHTHFPTILHAYFICTCITSLFSIVTGWAKITSVTKKTWDTIIQMVHFGKYSVATSISSYLLRGSDTFIIKFMFADPAVVGIYYLPQRLMEVIEIPLRSFIANALPSMSASFQRNDKRELTYIMKKYAGILTILLIPVSIVAFISADLVIELIGGKKFLDTYAANTFRIFMCFAILLPIDRFFGITFDVLNLPQKNMTKVILMLIVNVIGDFLGIFIFHNIYGVALASILTFVAGVFYGYWVLRKHLNFSIGDILKMGFSETKLLVLELFARLKVKTSE